jgi:hypothetical protein
VQDASFSERTSQMSALRRSSQPSDFGGCRNMYNMASSLMAQITELEGPRFEYRPLFSLATDRMVNTYVLQIYFHVFDVYVFRCKALAHVSFSRMKIDLGAVPPVTLVGIHSIYFEFRSTVSNSVTCAN